MPDAENQRTIKNRSEDNFSNCILQNTYPLPLFAEQNEQIHFSADTNFSSHLQNERKTSKTNNSEQIFCKLYFFKIFYCYLAM